MIAITGATGQLGRIVITDLLAGGVPAAEIVAVARSSAKAADLAALGVSVREADYADLDALTSAFAGIDKLLMISGSDPGSRLPQHHNVIAAAVATHVGHLIYTSVLRASTAQLGLAVDHKATEEAIVASGIPYTFLRNGWYLENYLANIADTIERGAIVGTAGDGRVAAAARADYAEAAAAVLVGTSFEGQILELGGDQAFTMTELAGFISAAAGRTVAYQDVPATTYAEILTSAGLPAPVVDLVVDIDVSVRRGDLDTDTGELTKLIGHSTADPATFFAAAVTAG